mmetsp:Transcript_2958/g.10366  ORF Transcript_2958/g.10366 Transcript_2958/m.10366 type:complete len:495 (+) Transcript_2958:1015-2499(+)
MLSNEGVTGRYDALLISNLRRRKSQRPLKNNVSRHVKSSGVLGGGPFPLGSCSPVSRLPIAMAFENFLLFDVASVAWVKTLFSSSLASLHAAAASRLAASSSCACAVFISAVSVYCVARRLFTKDWCFSFSVSNFPRSRTPSIDATCSSSFLRSICSFATERSVSVFVQCLCVAPSSASTRPSLPSLANKSARNALTSRPHSSFCATTRRVSAKRLCKSLVSISRSCFVVSSSALKEVTSDDFAQSCHFRSLSASDSAAEVCAASFPARSLFRSESARYLRASSSASECLSRNSPSCFRKLDASIVSALFKSLTRATSSSSAFRRAVTFSICSAWSLVVSIKPTSRVRTPSSSPSKNSSWRCASSRSCSASVRAANSSSKPAFETAASSRKPSIVSASCSRKPRSCKTAARACGSSRSRSRRREINGTMEERCANPRSNNAPAALRMDCTPASTPGHLGDVLSMILSTDRWSPSLFAARIMSAFNAPQSTSGTP